MTEYTSQADRPDRREQDSERISPRKLCRRLQKLTGKMRGRYVQANSRPARTPVEEWLCDNYYVLEKESKQAVRDIRMLARRSGAAGQGKALSGKEELSQIYAAFSRILRAEQPAFTDKNIAGILRALGTPGTDGKGPLSERQFAFVPAAIKAVLVEMVYTAVTESGDVDQMAYAITGFGKLGGIDLATIIQHSSDVEQILLEDPAGVYEKMTDESRTYYRHLVARIARLEKRSEQETAGSFLQQAIAENRHIGHAIVGSERLRAARRRRGVLAITLNVLIPLALCVLAGLLVRSAAVAVLLFLPLWEILRTPIQQIALAGVSVDFIPRMDLAKVEEKPATVVLVSTLLPGASETAALKRRLEQLYFSNSDPDMYYCILADLGEWDYPTDEKDESRIVATQKAIESLNRQYGERFMLFLRARTYNKTQGRYSGWERKRGAITEFIRFLKGQKTSLHTFVGNRAILDNIKLIIALDSDTNLLYESAQTLVSAAIHPLGRPVIGKDGVVTEGYGILVPKMSTDLRSAARTAFSRVMSGCGGVTAYDTRDKDFYQDLFGESIFAGKGLIDVDAFYELLDQRFPQNRVLSHDILEGAYLRCGFVSDVEMTDNAPAGMGSWLTRLHRWLRGDWQNIIFTARRYRVEGKVYENPISTLSKYKLFDNLRRSLTPVAALLCLIAALFLPEYRALLAVAGVLAVTFPSLWAAAWSLQGGLFSMSRKFFTRTLPHTFELIGQALLLLVMLPAQAFVTIDAALRSLWRTFISRKNLLEWTTAAQSERKKSGFWAVLRQYGLAELFGIVYLLLSYRTALVLPGLCFALVIPVARLSARPTREDGGRLSGKDRDTLVSYNAAMWRYYEHYANERNHFLPPDNVQQSPVYRLATRTSPTNIGMQMLSTLAARDFDFIDSEGLYLRVARTLDTVESLKKWHGNLINWYDTETLETLKPEFVSTVDSGNFVCCLVALKEGLREYLPEKSTFRELIVRIERLIDETDLSILYNKRKKLFSIGYDMDSGALVDSHYDFLMSEARLTSYFAVARKEVGKKHWGTMARTMSRWGSYAGPVSWTGTMFEYFMPHLLLPAYDGSLLGESLSYCLYCQKRRVKASGQPWGISESAFYAFDNNLNYQYKAHGVQKLGVKRYLDRDLVISPYSTFITLPYNPNSGMQNLSRLRDLGVYGHYGFYEAVDFTAERVGAGSLAVTRSYMAHHIGMSMIASANAVFDMRMQKRFMADNHMRSAEEFLQEKLAKSTVVYDNVASAEAQAENEKQERPRIREEKRDPSPLAPSCMLLTNGELTDLLTDTGAGYLQFGEIDLTRRDSDLLRRAQGILSIVRMDGTTLCATSAPFYDPDAQYSVEQQEQSVTFLASKRDVEVGVRCLIHPTISCQQRQIVVKNSGNTRQIAEVLCYLEPILASYSDYSAHPAYSKLFVTASYDEESRTLTFSRRNRDSTVDMYLTVGFLQDIDFVFETRREALMSAPGGMEELLHFPDKTFSCGGGGVPDACCALRFDLLVAPGGQQQATLLITATRTAAEGIQNMIAMRGRGALEPKNAARSPLLNDSLEARLGSVALGSLLFTSADCSENRADKRLNKLGQPALWPTGISGDLPIALLELPQGGDLGALAGYLKLHTVVRSLGIRFDLCVFCADERQRDECAALVAQHSAPSVVGARGGVFLLLAQTLSDETRTLIRAVARHTARGGMTGDAPAAPPFRPALIRAVAPVPLPAEPALSVEGGCFEGGRFYVDKSSPLPWSHVLANPTFGTLVSDHSPGYTWAINSRENKLTPWYNDIATDNTGEMAVLHDGESYYSLTRGARASFCRTDARYEGTTPKIASTLTITVSETGCAKYIDITLRNRSDRLREVECAYYIEPVLGVNRDTARHILPELVEGADRPVLALHNPYNAAVRCFAVLAGEGPGRERYMVDRAAFLSGDWQSVEIGPSNDPCAAVILSLRLAAGEEAKLRFTLAYGMTQQSAAYMATRPLPQRKPVSDFGENRIEIETPDESLNQYINHFAPNQILGSRIRGRCAFYQCGGAFGFRDQLQDVCAYLLLDPVVAKQQILRCCSVQFEQGDVLHWWHNLPKNAGGLRGIRTRFSDSLLWLPLAVADYVEKTGDDAILDLSVRYLTAPELLAEEQEKYIAPERSEHAGTVFEHCLRALARGHNIGENGLPKIGCGDWCDGFSAVGRKGRGTSVWLALFLSMVLDRFAKICVLRAREDLAQEMTGKAEMLREAVDAVGWDGGWYLRAFYDSGDKMGSAESDECQIDLLSQSFAVFAGMPQKSRVDRGMQSALDRLVDHKLRMVRLFDPPFQHTAQEPGYVKAYPSGIRENGGQYTHSAVWFAMALFGRGRVDDGFKILEMLNPAERARHPGLAQQYKLEPYAMAADIYANPSAAGRGGWSLYTGAASWYYRAVVEVLLGLEFRGERLHLSPRLPAHWLGASVRATLRDTALHIRIDRQAQGLLVDGAPAQFVPLDGAVHQVVVGLCDGEYS